MKVQLIYFSTLSSQCNLEGHLQFVVLSTFSTRFYCAERLNSFDKYWYFAISILKIKESSIYMLQTKYRVDTI